MYCPHCGKPKHEGAAFCPDTGKPLDASTAAPANPPGLSESCQIQHWTEQKMWSTMTYFWADAIGPKGKYRAGESTHVKGLVIKEAMLQAAHADLVKRLLGEGWRPSPDRGVNWWEVRFTR